ncbi:MAG TPA: PP2C family protein-serine/threonine phosphatase [Acidothermaceae bacterium]|nr:PP2C family protein-serine/threonine phosphatase [Acidothermaceae bacterium]
MDFAEAGAAALRSLVQAVHFARADDLPELAMRAGRELGARDTFIYLTDYDQVVLVRMTASGPAEQVVAVEGTLAGRAFSDLRLLDTTSADGALTVWAPLLDGTDRFGVIEFQFDRGAERSDELISTCRDVASLVAELTMTRARYGDLIERTRRRKPMTLAAEMQWGQLPPLTFVTSRVAIAGVLVPTDDVAGDSFDYAVNGDIAHVAIFDAMGHGLDATLMSSVAIGELRNSRRRQRPLVETVAAMDTTIAERFGPERFVTAIVAELDLTTGKWVWINCGHPPALIVRRGHVVKSLEGATNAPLGLLDGVPEAGTERLEPGDRLVLYTDGVTEARDEDGGFFGVERLVDFLTKQTAAGRPAAETLRRLNLAILEHQVDVLQDDATTVLVEWLTDEPDRSQP